MSLKLSPTQQKILVFIGIFLAIWLPRTLKLDQYVTVDESKWLVRSANFYQALHSGNLQHTFQHGHPGVTIMWSGMAGYLLRFPEYVQIAPGQFSWSTDQFDYFIAEHGHSSLQMLATGRAVVVLIGALALALAFLFARRVFGWIPSLLGFGLIALDPFQMALARVLHPDSLLSIFMLLSGLAYLSYLFAGRRRLELVVSAVAAALTVLTKTPGIFLVPLAGLFALIETVKYVAEMPGRPWRALFHPKTLARAAAPLLAWAAIMLVVYVALWPALWVAPRDTLAEVMDISGDYAEQGHSGPVFYAGRIFNGDPGTWFYPVNYLWRTTPIVLVGLLLVVPALFRRNAATRPRRVLYGVLSLALWAFFFIVAMNLGAKKFDRYILPIFMPLDLVAGIGWAAAVYWLARSARPWATRYAAPGLAALALAGQAFSALPTYPYYITYYNPLMGGAARAPEVMFIGWGEGLDEAARYLNDTIDTATAKVSSWYPRGPFSYYYDGITDSNRGTWNADYSVIYAHQWQRELPSRRMMHHFNRLTPEKTVTIDDIEFVRIYDMAGAPHADYTVDFGGAIRLVYYDTYSGVMLPGQKYDMTIYWDKIAPIDINANVLVRLVDQDGHQLMRIEGWPKGVATAKWEMGELLRDNNYEVRIPEGTPPGLYRIEVSIYDPATLDNLPVTSANTGEVLAQPYVLDYLIVGDLPEKPAYAINPQADFGGRIELFGADLQDAAGKPLRERDQRYLPGDTVNLRLFWRALSYMYTDYTAFVQVFGPDGQMAAQHDQQPLSGFIPTSYWPPRQVIVDDYALTLPAGAPPGNYQIIVGLYDLATMNRLPLSRDGEAAGDSVVAATFSVQVP